MVIRLILLFSNNNNNKNATFASRCLTLTIFIQFNRETKKHQMADERRKRGLKERFYLLEEQKDEAKGFVKFCVSGKTGRVYSIKCTKKHGIKSCTCPDHQGRNTKCKHMWFIQERVLKSDEETAYAIAITRPSKDESVEAPESILNEYKKRKMNENNSDAKTERRKWIDEECPICYEPMLESEETEWCKNQCGNSVHLGCWKTYTNSTQKHDCVWCRKSMICKDKQNVDSKYIKLDVGVESDEEWWRN